ncbi:hypothetical protein J2Z69_000548 [Paenibacillus shirakamiensis]|uniref:DUF3939 domain-containing protein n=1 Tax=Paenibacillus shirakamiensis TaxID=1265935 RepID=A0ABS4JG20_9BACL|nr:DUF3939 domain-containing protein [Paenibacillus shirakamiensis]MBP1999529.1 hypothetical protein [Paenibacillus shirakamiensis]
MNTWYGIRVLRTTVLMTVCALFILSMSGCMYPGKNGGQQASYRESVDRVQRAVDQFQKETGILPIVTASEDTPKYEKYKVNVDQLQKKGFIDEIPSSAYEMGGSVYFLIQNEEIKPTVKVMDLITVQKTNDVQRLVTKYKSAHAGKLPEFKEQSPGIYTVDLKVLNGESYAWTSFYSNQIVDFIMDKKGIIYPDYAFDLMQAVQKSGTKPELGKDIRDLLLDQSYYVPVRSLPYYWVNNQPVPQPNL